MTKFNFEQAREIYFVLSKKNCEYNIDFAMLVFQIQYKQYSKLFHACIRNLKCPTGENLFRYAEKYASSVVSNELTVCDDCYEISGSDTKTGNPVVVKFE